MSITAALITLNEEDNIKDCLESVRWADEIVIVDGGSEDRTLEKAKEFHPQIHEIPFRDFSTQKNAAIKASSADWIFFIDADERVTPQLRMEIQTICRGSKLDAVYQVKRLTYFFGKRLRFSGTGGDYPIRLFPRGHAHYEQPVHEKIVTELPVKKLGQSMIHYSTRDYSHYREKLDCYVPLEKTFMDQRGRKTYPGQSVIQMIVKFAYLYFLKLGLLDGWTGFEYARLSSYYDYLKYSK